MSWARTAVVLGALLCGFAVSAQLKLLAIGFQHSSSDFALYDVNPATGATSNPRNIGRVWAMAATANGTIYGVDHNTKALVIVDAVTGARTSVGGTPSMDGEGDLAVDPTSGVLYGVDTQAEFFAINTQTGATIPIGTIPAGSNKDISAIAFDASGRLYAADTMNGRLLEIDKNTANIVRSVPFSTSPGGSVAGLAFHPVTGKLYLHALAGISGSRFSTVDPTTGVMSVIANTPNPSGGVYALTFLPPPTTTSIPCNNCLRPPDGMSMWLPFDEATVIAPSSNVFGADGLRTGGTIEPGVVGGSACMNGATGYVTIPSYTVFANRFSIDAWVIRNAATGGTIFDKRTGAGSSVVRGVRFHILPNGTLGLQVGTGGAAVNFQSPATGTLLLPGMVFHHVAVTVERNSPSGGRMYVDGALIHTFSTMTPIGSSFLNASQMRIGADAQTVTNVFNGCIDELEVFDRVLAPQEVAAIYAAGRGGKCRVFGVSPFVAGICKATTVQQQHRICNASPLAQTITSYSFVGQPLLGSCNNFGPTSFAPLSGGPLTIPSGQCVTILVTVTPSFLQTPSVGVSCYRMVAVGSWGSTQTTGIVTNACGDSIQGSRTARAADPN